MNYRTDLALEQKELLKDEVPRGVSAEETDLGEVRITRIRVENDEGARALGKPVGTYVTIEMPPLSDNGDLDENKLAAIAKEITALLPEKGEVLVAGLGNSFITPDSLGPACTALIPATRHISGEIARSAGLEGMRGVSVLTPGVLGQTGIETSELLLGAVERVKPAAVIAIDALTSRRLSRLGCTVQISDSGIAPGSGVGNTRREISRATLGVPVIAVGVPTVVDAATLTRDIIEASGGKMERGEAVNSAGGGMVVTPREIDLLIERAARLVAMGINRALHPQISTEDMLMLVS